MKRVSLLSVTLMAMLVGCATNIKMSVVENENVTKIYNSGYEVGLSKKTALVGVSGEKTSDGYLRVWVYCRNDGAEPLNLIPENVSVQGYGYGGQRALFVYPPDRFLRKLRNSQAWALALQRLSSGIDAYNAGNKSSTTYSSSYNSNYGSTYGTSTTYSYDNAAAYQARAKNQELLNHQEAQYNSIYNAVENGILKSVTLFPGQFISGNVMVKYSMNYSDSLLILVPVGNDVHKIKLVRK